MILKKKLVFILLTLLFINFVTAANGVINLCSNVCGNAGTGTTNNYYLNGSSYNETYAIWAYNQTKPAMDYADTVAGGNLSWNQTFANTKYAAILWGYNMTTPFTNWLSTFLYNYNQTIGANAYADSVAGGNLSFNQTFTDTKYASIVWGYNMTTPFTNWLSTFLYNYNQSTASYNMYGQWWYNQTIGANDYADTKAGDNASWNQSFADARYANITWNYNMSDTKYFYNMSDTKYFYNMSDGTGSGDKFNQELNTTSNVTFGNITSPNFYNFTNTKYFYNMTQSPFFYNMTSPFNSWLSTFLYNYNATIGANAYTDAHSGTGDKFNQELNTTSNVTFGNVTAYNLYNFSNTKYFYNMSDTKYFYNMSDGVGTGNESWNQSFADARYSSIIWGYNMTTPFTSWLSTFVYNYNQTTPATDYANANFYNKSANVNVNTYNITQNQSKFCLDGSTCSKYITYNGSSTIIQG